MEYATIIAEPKLHLGTLLAAAHESLGRSLSAKIDASPRALSDSEKFLTVLGEINDPQLPPALHPSLLAHLSFSVLFIAPQEAMLRAAACAGLPLVEHPTIKSELHLAVMTGPLAAWHAAVISGTNDTDLRVVRLFNQLLGRFESLGLGSVWKDIPRTAKPGGLVALTDQRSK